MTPENKKFLDDNRHHYDTYIKAFYVRGLNAMEREGMQRVMREEFQPGYSADLWCGPCLVEMLVRLYRHYDEWLEKENKAKEIMEQLDREFDELLTQQDDETSGSE